MAFQKSSAMVCNSIDCETLKNTLQKDISQNPVECSEDKMCQSILCIELLMINIFAFSYSAGNINQQSQLFSGRCLLLFLFMCLTQKKQDHDAQSVIKEQDKDSRDRQLTCAGWFFFNCSSQFSVPKWKTMGSQSDILFHEILNVQKILVGWIRFCFLALKFGRNS